MSLADLLFYGDLEGAVRIGGPDVEKYLLREYQRDRRIEGIDIPRKNREWISGMHLNKALLQQLADNLQVHTFLR